MKQLFPGHYRSTADDVKKVWKSGLIVVDANVLLNLYKLPRLARVELVDFLRSVEGQLWIPHQVALEFQRGRQRVVQTERSLMSKARADVTSAMNSIISTVEKMTLPRRGIEVDVQSLKDGLKSAVSAIDTVLAAAEVGHFDKSVSDDPIRLEIDQLLHGRVGSGPETQGDLDTLCADGEVRYAREQPPGFADKKDGSFVFGGIEYKNKFGDLILWRQLLRFVREKNPVGVIFVTSDSKPDWWQVGFDGENWPHPELVAEMHRECGSRPFLMYTTDNFLEEARRYRSATISAASRQEIREAEASSAEDGLDDSQEADLLTRLSTNLGSLRLLLTQPVSARDLVAQWLRKHVHAGYITDTGFPNIVAEFDRDAQPYHAFVPKPFGRAAYSEMRDLITGLSQAATEQGLGKWGVALVCSSASDCLRYRIRFLDQKALPPGHHLFFHYDKEDVRLTAEALVE